MYVLVMILLDCVIIIICVVEFGEFVSVIYGFNGECIYLY